MHHRRISSRGLSYEDDATTTNVSNLNQPVSSSFEFYWAFLALCLADDESELFQDDAEENEAPESDRKSSKTNNNKRAELCLCLATLAGSIFCWAAAAAAFWAAASIPSHNSTPSNGPAEGRM